MDDDLGVAWLVKRVVVSRILRGKPAPDISDVGNALLAGNNAGRLVWASMVPDIIGKIVGRGPLEKEVAETYAHRLGEDLDKVSNDAAVEGYTASLGKGIDRSLSWARVSEAWGLDGRQMRSFIGSMKEDAYSGDIIPKRSAKQLEVMLNTRADRISENETYAIGQMAKQIHWIKMEQTGEIGPDTTKRWHTAADELVCPVCGPINGAIVALTANFATGVFAPPVHPNCRCWTEILESTVVTKGDYKRDMKGRFSHINQLGHKSATTAAMEAELNRMLTAERAHWENEGYSIEDQPNGDFIAKPPKRKAVAYDIDGMIAQGVGPLGERTLNRGVLNQMKRDKANGYNVLIITNRPNGWRAKTEEWLAANDVPYDQMLMPPKDKTRAKEMLGDAPDSRGLLSSKLENILSLQDQGYEIEAFYENDNAINRGLHNIGISIGTDQIDPQPVNNKMKVEVHPQTTIDVRGVKIEVDEQIAPTIKRLNEAGFITTYSCQGGVDEDPNEGYVAFASKNPDRRAIEDLLGLGRIPEWETNGTAEDMVNAPPLPYWEYWEDANSPWSLRLVPWNEVDMSRPEDHPFGRDTFGNTRPTEADISRMKKATMPLKGGKGGYDIVGGSTQGTSPFGSSISLVPTRNEKYYQMHYRDWYGNKIQHDLFSPDEYYARTWNMGTPYKQPTEEEAFSEEERAARRQKFAEIEERWAQNVAQAKAEGRAPSMPSEEDLRDYWHWDPSWAGAQGKWEGKYREFHPSSSRPPVEKHKMYAELQGLQNIEDERRKTLPEYEGLTSGRTIPIPSRQKVSYTPLDESWDDEWGLSPGGVGEKGGYPLRNPKVGDLNDPVWAEFASWHATPEAAMAAYKEDPWLLNENERRKRSQQGAALYRESQKVNTLAEVYNSGSQRNAERAFVNPKWHTQQIKLHRLKGDIKTRDASIRERAKEIRLENVGKSTGVITRDYDRNPKGQFAAQNTLVPRLDHYGPSLPRQRVVQPSPQRLTRSQMRRIKAETSGRVITTFDQTEPPIQQLQKIAFSIVHAQVGPRPELMPQEAHPVVQEKVAEVSQIIYDSKTRAGRKPKFKLKPKSVKMKVTAPTQEPKTQAPLGMPQPMGTQVGTFTSKPEVRGYGADEMIFVVLPDGMRGGVEEGKPIDFSKIPPVLAFDPKEVNLDQMGLANTTQVLMISGATWHPAKFRDGTGTLTGSYTPITYRYIDGQAAAAIHAQDGIEAFVMTPHIGENQSFSDVVETAPERQARELTRGDRTDYTYGEYDKNELMSRDVESGWVDPRGGAVLGGTVSGPGQNRSIVNQAKAAGLPREEYDEREWLKSRGLNREAVERRGEVNWASTETPYKPNSLSKRFPWPSPRKVL